MNIPLPDNGIPIQPGDTHYIYKDVYHPITWIGDSPYRPRVETLVIKDGNLIFLYMKTDKEGSAGTKGSYELPGGSIDADSTPIEQAENETNEEALMSIKDIYDSGIQYYEKYPGGFLMDGGDSPLEYEGHISSVFVAKYSGIYYKRAVEKKDLAPKIADNGKFYRIVDIVKFLRDEHVTALLNSPYVKSTTKGVIRLYRKMNNYVPPKYLDPFNTDKIVGKLLFISEVKDLNVFIRNGKFPVYDTIPNALIGYQVNRNKDLSKKPLLYVYTVDDTVDLHTPSNTESPSAKITGELWVTTTGNLPIKYQGLIQVVSDGSLGHYYYGKNSMFKQEYLKCDYRWIAKPNTTQPIVESSGVVVPGNKLYHGSTYEIAEFEPLSLNLGNAMEEPGWCTFAFADYTLALRFGLMRAIQKAKDYWGKRITCTWDIMESKPYISDKDFREVCDLIKGFVFYVYTIDATNLDVGIGNDDRLPEYTFSERGIKPEKTDVLRIDSTILNDNLIIVPDQDIEKKMNEQEVMAKYHHVRGWYSVMMTRDYNNGTASAKLQEAVSKGELKPGDDIREYMNTHGISFEDDSVKMSSVQESVVSKLNNNFEKRGEKSLSSLKKVPLTDVSVKMYKPKFKMLSHVRTGPNVNGYLYIGDSDCALISVETKGNGEKWIQALEITDGLQGYGLSKQLLSIATDKLGADFLSVNKKNGVAINLYKRNGWKIIDETNVMYYMSHNKSNVGPVQESVSIKDSMYFLSEVNMDGKIISPRVPDNFMIKNGYEDGTTKRICFAPSINKALMGLSQNMTGKHLFIHQPATGINKARLIKPSKEQVPDCKITGEMWYTAPIKLSCIGEIVVNGNKGLPGHKYIYGGNTAELYDWDWSWVTGEPVTESLLISKDTFDISFEDFESGKSNTVLVTGLSGSGKTTLGEKIANKYHAELIELDMFEQCYIFESDKQLKECGEVFYQYLSSHKSIWEKLKTKSIRGKELGEEIDKFLIYAISWCKRDTKNKYVLEGVQIYSFLNKQKIFGTPIVFVGTSALKSLMRRLKRAKEHNKDDFKNELSKLPQCIRWYIDENKQFEEFKKSVLESTGSGLGNTSYKSTLKEDFKSKGSMKLTSFRKLPLNKSNINKYKNQTNHFNYINFSGSKGYIFVDGDELVAFVIVDQSRDDTGDLKDYNWITDIEVTPKYRGRGLSKQLLDIATGELKGDFLTVTYDNEVAINLYKSYGFKISKSSYESIKSGESKSKMYTMFYKNRHPKNVEFVSESTEFGNSVTFASGKEYVVEIIDSLPMSEKKFMGNNVDEGFSRQFVSHTKNLKDREVLLVDGKPVAFLDVYTMPHMKPHEGTIVLAVRSGSKYRRKGYGSMLVERMQNRITRETGITKLIWEFDNDNIKSGMMGLTLGYKKEQQGVLTKTLESASSEQDYVFEVAQYSSTNKYPVFITLMHTGTKMATLIKRVTGDEFSHATISFNAKLHPTYSFGTKKLGGKERGLVMQNPEDPFFKQFKTHYATYVLYVTKEQRKQMLDRLQYFVENEPTLKYDAPALIACALHIPTEFRKKWFCSRFVMEILGQGQDLSKVPSLWKPQEIASLDNISLVNAGNDFYKYDSNATNANLELIKAGRQDEIDVVIPVAEMKDIFESGEFSEYTKYADLDSARGDVQESSIYDDTAYRITYDGEGIYNALKNNVSPQTWRILLNSKSMSWLPKPPSYTGHRLSYFTRDGYNMFMKHTMPVVKQYLDPHKIKVDTFDDLCNVCYVDKYQAITESVRERGINWAPIIEFNDRLNDMEYIIPNRGNIITNIKYDDYLNSYYGLSKEEFVKFNGGICLDYVMYQANYFRSKLNDVPYKTFWIQLKDRNHVKPTHTILLFYIDNDVYWFESSWKLMRGIRKFSCELEAFNCIIQQMIQYGSVGKNTISGAIVKEYNATDKDLVGISCLRYYEYMDKLPIKYSYKLSSRPVKLPEPISPVNPLPVSESCKNLDEARKFVRDVGKLAKKYNANYFIVTDGASGTSNNGNPAVRHAREAQIEWEKQHGFDPDEDWSESIQESWFPLMEAPKAIDEDKNGETPTDYTEDADEGEDIQTEELDTDKNSDGDDPEEATDYTEDADNEESGEIEEEPTDYTDGADGGDDFGDGGDDPSGDDPSESTDTEENNENGNPFDNNVLKNYSLLKNFEKLYELTKEVSDSLDSKVEPTKLQNIVLAQVLKNLNSIREFIVSYVKFQFAEDNYPQNLYYYKIVVHSLKLNLKLLKRNKELENN